MPRHLFADPSFSICVAAAVAIGFGTYGTLFIESIRLQNVRHLSALAAGLMMVPFTLSPTITTRAIDRFQPGMHFKLRLIIGHVAAAAGAAMMVLSVWVTDASVVEIGLGLLGISLGYITPAMTTGVLASSPTETAGVASGILNAGRQVGAALGVALVGTLAQTLGDRGLVISFAMMVVIYVMIGVLSARGIPLPVKR